MQAVQARFNYLFRSTKGLILVAIALISLVTAVWGMLSGPLKEWGVSALAVQLYGIRLVEAKREDRIIQLYRRRPICRKASTTAGCVVVVKTIMGIIYVSGSTIAPGPTTPAPVSASAV
jgi:hypothetical protein